MKERPILFSGPMVRAILEGRKTQTRRIVKCGHPSRILFVKLLEQLNILFGVFDDSLATPRFQIKSPYGKPGDRLWVRENYRFPNDCDNLPAARVAHTVDVWYEADGAHRESRGGIDWGWPKGKLRPNIFLPRWASRILLEIVSVRVERLNDISQADAIAEGGPPSHRSIDRISAKFGYPDFSRSWFGQLWEQINGEGSWAANPWVWVVEFKVLDQA